MAIGDMTLYYNAWLKNTAYIGFGGYSDLFYTTAKSVFLNCLRFNKNVANNPRIFFGTQYMHIYTDLILIIMLIVQDVDV